MMLPPIFFWSNKTIYSGEGMQQGDTMGLLHFCLLLHRHSLQLKSEFQALYLDDTTLAESCQDIVQNMPVTREEVDLGVNSKCREV